MNSTGEAMKHLVLLITILTGAIFNSSLLAQASGYVRTGFSIDDQTADDFHTILKRDIKELRNFSSKIDRFIILVNDEQWSRADFVKSALLRDMKDEIHQTERKIDVLSKGERLYKGKGELYRKRRVEGYFEKKNKYSKREDYSLEYELKEFYYRLQTQKHIMRDLASMRLGYGYDAWERSRNNEKLMIRFEDTMKEDITQTKRLIGRRR